MSSTDSTSSSGGWLRELIRRTIQAKSEQSTQVTVTTEAAATAVTATNDSHASRSIRRFTTSFFLGQLVLATSVSTVVMLILVWRLSRRYRRQYKHRQQLQRSYEKFRRDLRFGIDIGGTLCKLVYYEPDQVTSPHMASHKQRVGKFLRSSLHYGTTGRRDSDLEFHSTSNIHGTLHFIRFPTSSMSKFIETVKRHKLSPSQYEQLRNVQTQIQQASAWQESTNGSSTANNKVSQLLNAVTHTDSSSTTTSNDNVNLDQSEASDAEPTKYKQNGTQAQHISNHLNGTNANVEQPESSPTLSSLGSPTYSSTSSQPYDSDSQPLESPIFPVFSSMYDEKVRPNERSTSAPMPQLSLTQYSNGNSHSKAMNGTNQQDQENFNLQLSLNHYNNPDYNSKFNLQSADDSADTLPTRSTGQAEQTNTSAAPAPATAKATEDNDETQCSSPPSVCATGGGAYKFANLLRTQLQINLTITDELGSLVKGIDFTVHTYPDECYYLSKFRFREPIETSTYKRIDYPYLVVNIGSGVSILRVSGPNDFKRVGGTSLGGGTFYGLCKALTGCKSFKQAIEWAEHGRSSAADLLVGDIYGGSYSSLGLPAELVASSFGKLVRPNGLQNVRKEDLAKGLLIMITNNIGSLANLYAHKVMNWKAPQIVFVGNFLNENEIAKRCLAYATDFWSKGEVPAIFLQHEGYFGAIGSLC